MGLAGVGFLLICVAAYLVCRIYRIAATLPVLVVALLMLQVGVVHAAQVPGLAQAEDARDGLQAWSDQQRAQAREAYAQLLATRAALGVAEGESPTGR